MKLLLCSCAVVALAAGAPSNAGAAEPLTQVAVAPAPIHAIPASDAQAGPVINGPAPAQAAAPLPGPAAQPAPAGVPIAEMAPARPMVLADAGPIPSAPAAAPGPTPADATLVASLKPPAPAPEPIALTGDEAAFFTALGHRVTDAATAYDGYVRHAAAIDPRFADAAAVQRAVRTSAGYQPEQLQQGVVAYAAMVALRNPAFVQGVRAQADADPSFADRLMAQPFDVLQVRGAPQAAVDVAGVLHAHGIALQGAGIAIGKAAYDIQAQPWSRTAVANPVEVLASVKASALQARAADAPSEKMLLQSLISAPRTEMSGPPSATPAVVRGMALAALAVMGRAGDKEDLRVATLLQDALAADCMKMAMLNMNQCLAAAGPHYDDVFCVGEHSVGETARCVSTAADGGSMLQADPALRVARAQEQTQASPSQGAGPAYGPEQAAAYGYPQPAQAQDEPEQVAEASGYPEGDGTFNGQIYARRAQQRAPQEQATPPPPETPAYAYQNVAPPAPAQPIYAAQDAPPPAAYPNPYGQPGAGYGGYGGYYAPQPAYYQTQPYPARGDQ